MPLFKRKREFVVKVDEMALLALDDEKALNLYRRGFLSWIYAHLYSLSNFRSLMAMATDSAPVKKTKAAAADDKNEEAKEDKAKKAPAKKK